MTDDKQNAPQWALDAAREILRYWDITTDDRSSQIPETAAIIARHMAQRELAVAEAVRSAGVEVIRAYATGMSEIGQCSSEAMICLRTAAGKVRSLDLAPILASVTNREPDRCVWRWDDRSMMYDTGCGVGGAAMGEAKFCPNCGRKIEVKKEADDDK